MKYYFLTKYDEMCYNKQYFINYMKDNGLKELEVLEAISYNFSNIAWCKDLEFCIEINECGKWCEKYSPKNGISGCCRHYSRKLYEPSDKIITIKL